MNRNVEGHFSQLPSAEISRSRFDMSTDIKFTGNVGDLIPWFVQEVLPGDTFDVTTSKVVRLQTLLTPVMDNIYMDTYFFFVPNRLVWTHWKNFMGESEKAWIPEVEYTVPLLNNIDSSSVVGSGAVNTGDALDYMGIPVGVSNPYGSETIPTINALPYRAYQLIYNDWFRDENLIDPVNINTGDSQTLIRNLPRGCYKVAKYHDVFTSCLPGPQKGPSVAASINQIYDTALPVVTSNTEHDPTGWRMIGHLGTDLTDSDHYTRVGLYGTEPGSGETTDVKWQRQGPGAIGFEPTNLYTMVTRGGLTLNVNDIRLAVQQQKFYEKLARNGSRYTEIIKGMFNVESPDARLQRPEYLGGNRIPVSIHQITNQSQGESDFLGDLGAMSLTTDRNNDFVKSFTEHGFIIGLMCLRYDHSYPQGLEKFWRRRTRFQYYWPVFANLGEEAVYKQELYWDGQSADNVGHETNNQAFGYQERWYDYRYKPNRVAGEMRPGIANTLASWHFADNYATWPSLSKDWIEEDKTNVDRTLAVTSEVANQFFCDIYVQMYATRPMPTYSIPGLVDHH